MMNNKGFAVSAVLYTLLIAFLLFLGAALAMFSSSSSLVSNANNDLINGNYFAAQQVRGVFTGKTCKALGTKTDSSKEHYWYEGNALVRINSRYGTMYWPRDFGQSVVDGKITGTYKSNKNIEVQCILQDGIKNNCDGYDLAAGQGEPEKPVVPEQPPLVQDIVTMITEDDFRMRFNYIINDEWGETCPQTNSLSISRDSYYSTIDLIKNIEYYESIQNYELPGLYIENGEVSCFSGNLDRDTWSTSGVCDNNYDSRGFEEDFERFESYLESLPSPSSGTTYEYDRGTRIFTQKIKNTILGQISYITVTYFPVIYKFKFASDHVYKNDCGSGTFNTLVYYDLVTTDPFGTYIEDELQINGKDVDQFALYRDYERVGSYFFNSGEYDKAYDDGSSSDNDPTEPPAPPVIKPKSWGNLYIRDMLTDVVIKDGKFSLFDICE